MDLPWPISCFRHGSASMLIFPNFMSVLILLLSWLYVDPNSISTLDSLRSWLYFYLGSDPISMLVLSWFRTTEISFLEESQKNLSIFSKTGGGTFPSSPSVTNTRLALSLDLKIFHRQFDGSSYYRNQIHKEQIWKIQIFSILIKKRWTGKGTFSISFGRVNPVSIFFWI